MKKYLLISKEGEKEMNEEEMTNYFFSELFLHFQENIEAEFKKKKINAVNNEYGRNYKYRPEFTENCLVDNCNKSPIYSHSISELAVLKNIASNDNNVYTISSNRKEKVRKVGIHRQASVFPGFCEEHDRELFTKLDIPENKTFDNEFYSQLMLRTISREKYVRNRAIYSKEKLIKRLKKEHEKSVKEFFDEFNKTLFNKRLKFINHESNSFDIHFATEKLRKQIEEAQLILSKLDFDFLINNPAGKGMVVKHTLPIAFSGLCNFDNSGTYLLINCLPYKDRTTISLFYPENDARRIEKYLTKYDLENENSILKLVEKMAIRGTDNIFLNIEYWDNLEKKMRDEILMDFMDIENSNIQNEIDYSFLNWTR